MSGDSSSTATEWPCVFGSKEIGRVLGITQRQVNDLAKDGRLPKIGKNKFDLEKTVQAFVDYKVMGVNESPADMSDRQKKEFAAERLRKLKLEADKLQFEKSQREKAWAPIDSYVTEFQSALTPVREAMEDCLEELKLEIPDIKAAVSTRMDSKLADAFNSIVVE